MSPKISADHLARAAIVYVRQSTMAQVVGNLESQRRQYDLAGAARAAGFKTVTVIDDDLGRSGSGSVERPGFDRLVAMVCSGDVGAVYCIEASRLARNGRDWHHLIDLCALAGALVIDPEGAYDPRIVNDRLLLGLKGTMSEYELSLMRQRGLAARDSKAKRGEFRFMLPPGFCWSESGKNEIDPDEHVQEAVRMVFAKFRELASARQAFLWFRSADIKMPVVRKNTEVCKVVWKSPAYRTVMQILHNPLHAGAYAFGRRAQRTQIVDGRAHKINGIRKPEQEWSVLLRDHHAGYITWREYEANQKLLLENAYMKKNCARKSAPGGRALLTGLMRCGRGGRMMRVFYGMGKGHAHRYQCRGDDGHVAPACASGSAACASIALSLCNSSKPSLIAPPKPPFSLRIRSNAPPTTSSLRRSETSKRRAMKRALRLAGTNWSIPQSALSRANWRRAGAAPWRRSSRSKTASQTCARPPRRGRRLIAPR